MAGRAATRPLVTTFATIVGAAFLLIGILGFIPGITTDYGDLYLAGHESGAKLLGVFQVSVLHNLVHIAFGIAGLAMARSVATARTFLIGGGAVYLVLWLYGLAVHESSPANFVPFNTADNWLHLFLGVGMISLGLLASRRSPA
ncbi:DUF4383 domain-containing protein [Micromonospora sp. NPDC049679]|uniref:DUF4383 domain-containing protein n=1 Tax=Micromonospora sp. NPDC049679 TaxID=3155920 RepID=UPI0033E0682A